ncbi:hypothetical protein MC7420_4756 [Coleofasciculus chthonoplastes PCC 7420]|uniref:Uncharacterized protein n=1 Tax=Coleofasciculus chthonoplastes PCC 7420 TaxID=118168 RepID=B4VN84_9CYAN|nr:hypothetical protein MC7420_4756 [Coleofasciculus chthonoplastes PCC 7420]
MGRDRTRKSRDVLSGNSHKFKKRFVFLSYSPKQRGRKDLNL